ncbi:MAG: hypothetical protein ISS15_02255 [Alphaproteobacteria bacterium]|nr:hypothetical protein [Alphaproteobacteria bacterium]MBL6938396.1 hypothetical protein [Alphaproteobacteria bacterium]MBL7096455.1 hypothetical protein [Alphaproteobacteria bacterium]
MAEPAKPLLADIAISKPVLDSVTTEGPLATLARMHHEAVETARLANLLGRSLQAAIGLPILAALAVFTAGGTGVPQTTAWAILVAVASLSIARAYGSAINQPFERAVLRAFAKDIDACVLYAGFAWGAGAFLALGPGATPLTVLAFAGVPTTGIAILLRDRLPVLLFLAPVAALTSFACVVRSFADGSLAAGLVLILSAMVAASVILVERHAAARREADLPNGFPAS